MSKFCNTPKFVLEGINMESQYKIWPKLGLTGNVGPRTPWATADKRPVREARLTKCRQG